jgi:N-acetylneuraminate synthase
VGLSDHTLGIGVSIAAVALGASIIEKHLTLRRADGGPDSEFSMEPHEMAELVREAKAASAAVGSVVYGGTPGEEASRQGRRSLYVVSDIQAGERFTSSNVRSIRPGYGLAPRFLAMVMGKRASVNLSRGTALRWDHIA